MAELTPSQTVGPFFGFALPFPDGHRLVDAEEPGAIRIEGQVLDGEGQPVPDALVEIWQAGPDGRYPRDSDAGFTGFTGFGRCGTDGEGLFRFVTLKPGPSRARDGRLQAPHLVLIVFARGLLRHLVTRMYFPDEPEANAADPLLAHVDPAVRVTLMAHEEAGILRFDVHLQGERETAFLAI